MMVSRFWSMPLLCGFYLVVFLALPAQSETDTNEETFDAVTAWTEFEAQFRLFYAYFERTDFDANAVLSATRETATAAATADEFRSLLQQMLFAWTDAHLLVGPLQQREFNIIPTNSDLVIRLEDQRYIVRDVRSASVADQNGVRPGWELLSVSGVPLHELSRRTLGTAVPNPTDKQLSYAATLVANGRDSEPRIHSYADHTPQVVSVKMPSPTAAPQDALRTVDVSSRGDVGILRLNNSLGNNQTIFDFDRALAELAETSALIVDLRNTPSGGNTEVARSILGHFIEGTQSYQVHEIPSLEREFSVPRRFIEQVKPRVPLYPSARVVVLGGFWTGSMGEGLVIGFDAATDAHVIASDMADLLGGLYTIDLAWSAGRMSLGRESLFHVDGTPREDFVAPQELWSADRDRRGDDPAIAAAMAYLLDE